MTTPHARCESCGVSLPPNAFRCPTCGHQQGDAITIEVGRGPSFGRRFPGPRSRRDLIILVCVVAFVLAGLVFVGRDSGGGASAAAKATTTSVRPTTSTSSITTTSTAPTTTTSTTLPRLQLGERTGVKLLVGSNNTWSVVDLDTGETTRPALSNSPIVLRPGGVVITRAMNAYFVPDPYSETGVDLGVADSVIAAADADRVWLLQYNVQPGLTVREVDLAGSVTAGPFIVPGESGVIAAVRDGVITAAHGSIYVVDRTGTPRRIGTGDVIGAAGNSVLADSCDEHLQCATSVIDVASGDSRALAGFQDVTRNGYSFYVANDGTTAAAFSGTPAGELEVYLIDLDSATARKTPLRLSNDGVGVVTFSRDSRWMFFVSGRDVFGYAPDIGEQHMLLLGDQSATYIAVV